MGVVGFIFKRIIPAIILLIAIFIGWCAQSETPEGLFFAVLVPVLKGYKPPAIFGHGRMIGTPPVPDDMMPEPRPEHEKLLDVPGSAKKMPQNGLGMCCRPTAYDDVLVERSVLWYLLLGGRHIDGAHLYLNNRAIGRGIQEAIKRGVPREEIWFTSKIFPSHFGYNSTMELVPTFLEETGLDYIDLVLMHAPARAGIPMKTCGDLSIKECRKDTWKALSELRKQGVIKNAGVSNFVVKHLQEIMELEGNDLAPVANNQFQWNPWAPQEWVDTVEYCHNHGITITAYNSLGGTLESHKAHDIEVLTRLSKKYNRSVAQIMLRWSIQIGTAVIPGTGK